LPARCKTRSKKQEARVLPPIFVKITIVQPTIRHFFVKMHKTRSKRKRVERTSHPDSKPKPCPQPKQRHPSSAYGKFAQQDIRQIFHPSGHFSAGGPGGDPPGARGVPGGRRASGPPGGGLGAAPPRWEHQAILSTQLRGRTQPKCKPIPPNQRQEARTPPHYFRQIHDCSTAKTRILRHYAQKQTNGLLFPQIYGIITLVN
jgi:hypothetical protein